MQTPGKHRGKHRVRRFLSWLAVPALLVLLATASRSQVPAKKKKAMDGSPPVKTSYDQIAPALVGQESFQAMMAKDKADKPAVMQRQKKLLAMGSGRKSEVNRAQEKVSALQQKN